MKLVEKELTMLNVERARQNPELEKLNETEQKLTPRNPELLNELFRAQALPVEQVYLSSPYDKFSLRVRCSYKPEGLEFTTTQKSRGEIVEDALQRGEVEEEISEEAYNYYRDLDLPIVRKLRAKVMDGVTVDFYDDDTEPVIVEIEDNDPEVRVQMLKMMQELSGGDLVDRSDDPALTNEAIAHRQYEQSGKTEHLKAKPESLDHFSDRVLGEMVAQYATGRDRVVVGLTGMSGSGKTTVTTALQERIVEMFGEAYKPIVISTDDYHFGKKRLEEEYGTPYNDWDDGKTYDTDQLAADLTVLAEGLPIPSRHFDFDTEEPSFDGVIENSPFVIIEGLYAGSKNLDAVRTIHFQLPTGIATAVGRDVRRLVIDNRANRAFPTPQSRLKYQIEVALPKYLEQQMPQLTAFSASTRPLASRAFMLAELSK